MSWRRTWQTALASLPRKPQMESQRNLYSEISGKCTFSCPHPVVTGLSFPINYTHGRASLGGFFFLQSKMVPAKQWLDEKLKIQAQAERERRQKPKM
uniref:Uncharacterized protein n=1 Tax=Vombatus ursinus TaxID=29139 RepID=A0A4X2LQC3_VOMUR